MRALLVHNRYSSRVPSGENAVVDDEARWLRAQGVEVARHEVDNDSIVDPGPLARALDGLEAVWSLSARRRAARVLDEVRPDVVHVHNLFPLLTASVAAAALDRGLPVVWTVHNFRLRCVAGTHFRDGRPCHDCRPGWKAPGVAHRCYAGSTAASALVGAATSVYGALARRRGVTALPISRVMARWLVAAAGFPEAAVRVKYNGVAAPAGEVPPPEAQRDLVYVGRLAPEKGVGLLLDAFARTRTSARLVVVGGGPLEGAVRSAAVADPRVVPVGQVAVDEVERHLLGARALVMPSVWQEPFGRVAAEALARGRPVVTTGEGAAGEVVTPDVGWVTGTDPDALAAAIEQAADDDGAVAERGRRGRERHARLFSPEATTAALVAIYEEVVTRRGTGARR
ncbi:MAG: glycosyltransferase [Thermoanaerobacterales bacterium]|nr:glycosyltransferase [Thermoanaerobacterales bacterium]